MKPAPQQPITTEIRMADGVFAKTMVIHKAGTAVPQHAHSFDHVSVLVRGSVSLQREGQPIRRFSAPCGITILARMKHLFTALEDGTIILCVHDIGSAEGVSVHEEHQIVDPA